MKNKILTAALALTIAGGAATTASAQVYGYYGGNAYHSGYDRQDARRDRREYRQDRREVRQDRRQFRREVRQHRRWARGQVMPYQYRTRAYVVNDYHRYRLSAPPRGYHYVRDGNDVVLAAVATGLIAAVFAGMFN